MKRITESKDVTIYKALLQILGEYSTKVPGTGMDRLLDAVIEQGKKILPKDERALMILSYVLGHGTPAAVQKLLNIRFSDLPPELKPMNKAGRRHQVPFWTRDTHTSDKVKDLIDWSATGKAGQWTDTNGEKVDLLDKEGV